MKNGNAVTVPPWPTVFSYTSVYYRSHFRTFGAFEYERLLYTEPCRYDFMSGARYIFLISLPTARLCLYRLKFVMVYSRFVRKERLHICTFFGNKVWLGFVVFPEIIYLTFGIRSDLFESHRHLIGLQAFTTV